MHETILDQDTLGAGCHWSLQVGRGHTLRLTDVQGGANVGMLMFNPYNLLERLNIPDTLKCQHTFLLSKGHALYSDMGRVFCSIAEDSVGWHDSVCGTCDKQQVAERWGVLDYQAARNGMHRNGRDAFLIELAKYGLDRRDLVANLNLFSKIVPDADGNLTHVPGASKAGDAVSLRFEMDTLVILHTCPHPLDLSQDYPARPVRFELLEGVPSVQQHSRDENRRGFTNTALYAGQCCGGHH